MEVGATAVQAWDKGLVNFLQEINLETGGKLSIGNGSLSDIFAPGYEDIAHKLESQIPHNETNM